MPSLSYGDRLYSRDAILWTTWSCEQVSSIWAHTHRLNIHTLLASMYKQDQNTHSCEQLISSCCSISSCLILWMREIGGRELPSQIHDHDHMHKMCAPGKKTEKDYRSLKEKCDVLRDVAFKSRSTCCNQHSDRIQWTRSARASKCHRQIRLLISEANDRVKETDKNHRFLLLFLLKITFSDSVYTWFCERWMWSPQLFTESRHDCI